MTLTSRALLDSDDPEQVVRCLETFTGELMEQLEEVVPRARKGGERAVRVYMQAWKRLEHEVLMESARQEPDLIVETSDGLFIVDVKGRPSPFLTELLDQEA